MARSTRILIVDDEPEILEILQLHLSRRGHHVETALSGKAALETMARALPDVVLLDLRMPGMDGFELLQRIRTQAPVIIVSANANASIARVALKNGAFDYVAKPIDLNHLDRVIAAALA